MERTCCYGFVPSGFPVVFEKPNRRPCAFTLVCNVCCDGGWGAVCTRYNELLALARTSLTTAIAQATTVVECTCPSLFHHVVFFFLHCRCFNVPRRRLVTLPTPTPLIPRQANWRGCCTWWARLLAQWFLGT
jgi:hypothetical protein